MKCSITVIVLFLLFYCRTFTESTISNKENQFLKTQDPMQQEKIIIEMYEKKDQVPENQKDEFVNFFKNKDLDVAKEKLQELYYDPNFSQQKESIFTYSLKNLDDKNVSFVREELKKNVELYTPSLKHELLQLGTKEAATIFLDQIYLGREKLDAEIIHLFKNTQYVESLPVLINSIENHDYVEESFSAISEFRVEEADTFLVNVATDWNYPYREFGIAYLYKIDNKPLAISVYKNVLKNQIQKQRLVVLSLKGLEELYDFLEETDKEELKILLKKIKSQYPEIPLNQYRFSSLLEDLVPTKPKEVTTETPTTPNSSDVSKDQKLKREPIEKRKEIVVTKNEQKKEKIELNQTIKLKPKAIEKNKKYLQDLEKKFYVLFGEDGRQILIKINNALLTYSTSNSEKAKFVQKSYEVCFHVTDQEKILQSLKEGLMIHYSFHCIMKFIDKQYARNDLRIFALQEIFVLRRKEAEILIKNKKDFL